MPSPIQAALLDFWTQKTLDASPTSGGSVAFPAKVLIGFRWALSGFLISLCHEPGWKLLHSSCARASNLVISCASPWHFKSSCHASRNWEDHVRSSVVENHATLSIAAWHMRRKTSNCACMLGGYFAIPKLMQLCEGMRGYVNIC